MRALLIALALLGACKLNPYDLSGEGGGDAGDGDDMGDATGDAGLDDAGDGGVIDSPMCTELGPDDTCNEIDDDCNGVVDDDFDKLNDPNNCGVCNNRCIGDGSTLSCENGACAFEACLPGFADLDADPLTCEYQCPLFPPRAEDCNGFDEDCDGAIDEDLPAPPTGQCRVTAGTPCAGTTMVCETRGTETRWWCDYSDDVEFDPSVPNGIVLVEQRCDGEDGNCDGLVDNSFVDLGQECDNGGLGVCRDVGVRRCDSANPAQTTCDLSVLPDAQAPGVEACDGLDNNCDGTVDNATGPNRVIDAMSHITVGGQDYYIDTFEASHPDSTATTTGISAARACSKPGVLPWRSVTFSAAQAACAAAGKVLCTGAQWQTACEGAANSTYPYGNTFSGAQCNTEPYDPVPGGENDDVVVPTGSATCTASTGVQDLSGNLREWTDDITGMSGGQSIVVLRGGAYDTPAVGATCDFRLSRGAANVIEATNGFRCCKATAP